MKTIRHILFVLAMIMALPVVTACNDDEDKIDYTEYYGWRDQNLLLSEILWEAHEKDGEGTYFNHIVTSLKEPQSFPTYVHYFRHANVDSLAQLSPRKDFRPYANSTLSVHYTLFDTKSVMERMEELTKASSKTYDLAVRDLLLNPGGSFDSIFFANAIDNKLKADTLESSQVAFFKDFTPQTVITGWGDVLQNMYIGDNVVVMIPWFLAYGQAGSGKTIDPYTNLFFRIELCDITRLGATVK